MRNSPRENPSPYDKFPTALLTGSYLVLLAFFLAIFFISSQTSLPMQNFLADPAYLLDVHPLVGVVSNLGVLFWCSAAAISLFTYFYLRSFCHNYDTLFLLCSGLLSLLLLFDDFFMLHEELIPEYLYIPELWIYVLYLIPVLTWVFYFSEQIWQSEYMLLGVAVFLLGLSVLTDLILPQDKQIVYLIEEGLKFYGIITWLIYFTRDSLLRIRKNLTVSTR